MAKQTDADGAATGKEAKGKGKNKGKNKDESQAEDKAKAKGRGGKRGAGKQSDVNGLSVANDVRASRQVRRAKGWGGLLGFAVTACLSWRAGVPFAELGVRALLAGIGGYLVGWGCVVSMWRAILLAELHARLDRARSDPASENVKRS